jgi:outer membrane protein assembly factor BamB/orotate phosphoribosyltransferase
MDLNSETEELKNFIRENCVLHRDHYLKYQPIKKNGNGKFLWVFDFKKTILNPRCLEIISEMFWQKYNGADFQIAGIETSGALMAASIASYINAKYGTSINCLVVKKKRKKDSQMTLVDGEYQENIPIIIVDDALNTLSSLNSAVAVFLNEYPQAVIQRGFFLCRMNEEKNGVLSILNQQILCESVFSKGELSPESLGKLHKIEVQQPKILWKFESENPNLAFAVAKSSPVLYKDSVLFGSDSGVFWCLKTEDGSVKWKFDTHTVGNKGIISSPFLSGDSVFFGNYNGRIFELDAETGEGRKSIKLCEWIGSSPIVVGNDIFVGLEFDDKAKTRGGFGSINKDTLDVNWFIPLLNQQHGSACYSEKHDAIIFGTNDSEVIACDRATGKVINLLKVGGPVKYHPATVDDLCVFGSFDGGIYVWDFIKNEIKLKVKTDNIVYSRPLIYENKAFMGSADGFFYTICLETFEVLNKFYCGEKIHSSPSLIEGFVYFGVSNGNLVKVDPSSGDPVEVFSFPERLTNSAIANDKNIFVYDYKNCFYSIKK